MPLIPPSFLNADVISLSPDALNVTPLIEERPLDSVFKAPDSFDICDVSILFNVLIFLASLEKSAFLVFFEKLLVEFASLLIPDPMVANPRLFTVARDELSRPNLLISVSIDLIAVCECVLSGISKLSTSIPISHTP